MCEKQKSLEVLVTAMRHKMEIKNTDIDAEMFYYLGLGLVLSCTLQKFPEIHHVTQTQIHHVTGLDTSAHQFQPGDWIYVKWWDISLTN